MTWEEMITERFMFLYLICVQNLGQGQQPEKSVEGSPLTSSGHKTEETTGLHVMIKELYKAQRPECKLTKCLTSIFFFSSEKLLDEGLSSLPFVKSWSLISLNYQVILQVPHNFLVQQKKTAIDVSHPWFKPKNKYAHAIHMVVLLKL